MSYSCAEWRGDIGAYIVGALDGRARARVSRHLVACPGCRADYDDLVPVGAWLGRLALAGRRPEPGRAGEPGRPPHAWISADLLQDPRSDAARRPNPHPGAGSWSPASAPSPGRLRATRARSRRSLLAAVVAAAAAAAFLAALVISGPSARGYSAADNATGVSGRAQLHATPAGTEIDLTATGLPGGKRCILVAVARDGSDIAGTWDATYDGSARIAGTSEFPASQLTALRIEADTGRVLLSIRVRP
jgi:anti-sigma factor RsiW